MEESIRTAKAQATEDWVEAVSREGGFAALVRATATLNILSLEGNGISDDEGSARKTGDTERCEDRETEEGRGKRARAEIRSE